jgi:class 3 adenylate cyclase
MAVGIIAPFLLLAGYLAVLSFSAEVARLRQGALDEARERASDVDMLIVGWRQTLDVLAQTPAFRERRADEANQIFTDLIQTYPYLLNAGVLDDSLTIWSATVPQVRGIKVTGAQGTQLREAMALGTFSASAPVTFAAGRTQPVSLVWLRQPTRSRDGTVNGLIQIGLPFETLQSALNLSTMTPSAVVLILSEDGTVLARGDGLEEGAGTSFLAALAKQKPQGASGVLNLRDDAGQEWFLAYQRSSSLPWYAAVVQPQSAAFAPARQVLQGTVITVLSVLLLTVIISRRVSIGVVRPIRQLTVASRAIGRREFGHRVPLSGDADIRQVTAAFNQMASEMERAYRDLELRVAERTAELEHARSELERLNAGLQETVTNQVEEINRTALLKRYLSPQIAEVLINDHERIVGPTHRRELTVMFVDLRGFTALSEVLPPDQLVPLLNSYLSALTEAVFAEGGTLDKYLGDGLMAFFGDPVEYPDHASRAVRAALAMQQAIRGVRDELSLPGDIPLAIGVGITSGPVTVGTIGSPNRLEYTVVGNNVNLASRLTGLAGPGEILCDAATAKAISGWATTVNRGPDFVKGRSRPVTIYEIQGVTSAVAVNGS